VGVGLLEEVNEWEKSPGDIDHEGGEQPTTVRHEGLACVTMWRNRPSGHIGPGLLTLFLECCTAEWTTKARFISTIQIGRSGCHNVRNQQATLNFLVNRHKPAPLRGSETGI
jgi:hypothetical protein